MTVSVIELIHQLFFSSYYWYVYDFIHSNIFVFNQEFVKQFCIWVIHYRKNYLLKTLSEHINLEFYRTYVVEEKV